MAELHGLDLATHLQAIIAEFESRQSIYGYPGRKIFRGFPGFDFSVDFQGRRAATPLGPAAGPHTQMAQNIILSFLGGGRIMELKTVQVLDQLDIPRPCIDIRNVGYNVEWSQELRLEASYREYVTAWVLLKIIEEMELLGVPRGDPFYETIFDISVGYDLAGISSPRIHGWLENMKDASETIRSMLEGLPDEFAKYRELEIDPRISDSVTLSTFHGCPRDEIEAIVEHLISEHRFHVIVKMNPTIMGYEFTEKTLRADLGYEHIELDPAAFENDLQFDEGVAMMKRLRNFAGKLGRTVGAKFTNTLVVRNSQDVFRDEVMYLSGAPLNVLAMHAVHPFREELGADFPVSFSAGINKHNFADAVSCNMKPVTTCTDLLVTGGYTRMLDYLQNLKAAMEAVGACNVRDFIVASAGTGADVHAAGMANTRRIVAGLVENPRYHYRMNRKSPPKIESHLTLFDCITCYKCIPVCPNAANFSIPTGAVDEPVTHYRFDAGKFVPVSGERFVLKKEDQIANLADWCNKCGNCDTYCPEHGGPFVEKPRFFASRQSFEQFCAYDGFYFPSPSSMTARIDGIEYLLSFDPSKEEYRWRTGEVEMIVDARGNLREGEALAALPDGAQIDMTAFHIARALFRGFMDGPASFASTLLR